MKHELSDIDSQKMDPQKMDSQKWDMLLDLLEHPEKYSETQKDELLGDEEVNELYQQLVEIRQSLDFAKSKEEMKLPSIDAEWEKLKDEMKLKEEKQQKEEMSQNAETHGEHTLRVHVGEAQRTHDALHAFLAAIVFDSLEQRARHLNVVDEVYPSESHVLTLPALVGTVVDDGCHTAHQASVAIGKVVFGLAEVEGGIAVAAQSVEFIAVEVGHVIGVASI